MIYYMTIRFVKKSCGSRLYIVPLAEDEVPLKLHLLLYCDNLFYCIILHIYDTGLLPEAKIF